MSYEIVKSIKIDKKEKKVFITSACNNITPRNFSRWQVQTLTSIFQEYGYETLLKEILYAYYSGEFQTGNHNDYSKSLMLLNRDIYNWSAKSDGIITDEEIKSELYKNYLTMKSEPTGKFIIYCKNRDAYVRRFTSHHVYNTDCKTNAQIFKKISDIKLKMNRYNYIPYNILNIETT